MTYPRENTILTGGTSASGAAQTVKLPNASTGALPGTQLAGINPIGASSRWRIKFLSVTFAPIISAAVLIVVTDGHVTWNFNVTQLVLNDIDWQFAGGAEVDISVPLTATTVSYINVSAVSEG